MINIVCLCRRRGSRPRRPPTAGPEKERTPLGYPQWTFTERKGTSGTIKASTAKLTSETL